MGQYHLVANMDKREFLHPHRFGDGLKLLEFACSADGTLAGLAILLACSNGRGGGDLHLETYEYDKSDNLLVQALNGADEAREYVGRWAGDRIAVIGDYAEPDDFPGLTREDIDTLWGDEEGNRTGWTDVSAPVIRALAMDSYLRDSLSKRRDWTTRDERNLLGEPLVEEEHGALRPDMVIEN